MSRQSSWIFQIFEISLLHSWCLAEALPRRHLGNILKALRRLMVNSWYHLVAHQHCEKPWLAQLQEHKFDKRHNSWSLESSRWDDCCELLHLMSPVLQKLRQQSIPQHWHLNIYQGFYCLKLYAYPDCKFFFFLYFFFYFILLHFCICSAFPLPFNCNFNSVNSVQVGQRGGG